jgi:acetyl-CoA acetyltransferase
MERPERSYHGKVAIASAAMTALGPNSGRTVLSLATEACKAALDAAGLPARAVDGIATYSMYDDSVAAEAVAGALGLPELSYVMDFNQGGQSASFMAMNAAMAIHCGLANTVLVFRALNGRSGSRVGRVRAAGAGPDLRYPVGLVAYPQVQALWARRYMIETGATEHDLAAAAINASKHASVNPRAVRRQRVTETDYFASPYVAEPYRVLDCTIEIDGACAIVVTSVERARDLKLAPAVIESSAWRTHGFDLDMASFLCYDDLSRNYAFHLRDRLWGLAGLSPHEVDVASLYDCFTGVLLQNVEGLGICEIGEAGQFLRRQDIDGGRPVINPSGGLLAEGYLHGMNILAEAVWQVQHTAGPTQVPACSTALTCSGGALSGSAMILARDHHARGAA